MKREITYILSAILASGFSYAATVTAENSGSWSNTATWAGGVLPTEADSVTIKSGVTVTLDTAATIEKLNHYNSDESHTLIVTGSDASLTLTGTTQLWNNNRLQLFVENGASLTANSIAWGSGGYNNITVSGTGTTFTSAFAELRGSTVNGGSVFKVTDGATANATGEWKLNANHGGTMIFEISNGATLNINKSLYFDAASNSSSVMKVLSGGKVLAASGNTIGINYWNALQSGSENRLIIAGEGSQIKTQGTNGNIYVGNQFTTAGAEITSHLQLGTVENGEFMAASGNAVNTDYEFRVYASGQVDIMLGAENAISYGEMVNYEDVLINAKYFKQIEGGLTVDFSNVTGLEEGLYSFALFASNSGENLDFDNWSDLFLNGVVETENVKLYFDEEDGKCYDISGNILYLNVQVVPEPATYAAIFGALALAFAAYRRRK